MWFLIKSAFWIGLVVLLLPEPEGSKGAGGPKISTVEALGVLHSAVNDAKGFCDRNPSACVTGAAAVQSFGHKAQNGAKLLHEFISEKVEENKALVPPRAAGRSPSSDAAPEAPAHGPTAQRAVEAKKRS